ncbi:MAG: hypothetical protein KGQ93_08245 [Cyanobacteria bacterium REEB459]|nr:hypothetical protein [Cyanobacteria bacterium REEB459]
MGIRQELARAGRRLMVVLAIALLSWTSWGCARPTQPQALLSDPAVVPNRLTSELAEVSPPEPLVVLKQIIDAYTPQVRILSPRPGEIVESTSVAVRIQARGLPLFKDPAWQLGPHLQLFLDDHPYQEIFDLSEPIRLENLAPGTHTLRVFAARPWHESFKNQGAFDQRTFHIFAQTPQKQVSERIPLLTYSQPQGTYGAEPILLDFYLSNAPLHANAQLDQDGEVRDWRIRCTVNGQSFVFDQWQPIYLKGFKPGNNWIQLELIDSTGNPIENRFNNVVRTIDYQPGGQDTLSRLVRGELNLQQVAGIIDPTYPPPPALPEELEQESPDQGPETNQPNLEAKQPSLEEKQLGLEDNQPSLEAKQPSLEEKQLGLEENQPSLETKQPSLEEKQLGLEENQPSLEEKQLGLEENQPSLETKQHSLETKQPSLEEKQPNPEVKSESSLEQRSPQDPAAISPLEPTNQGNPDPTPNSPSTGTLPGELGPPANPAMTPTPWFDRKPLTQQLTI